MTLRAGSGILCALLWLGCQSADLAPDSGGDLGTADQGADQGTADVGLADLGADLGPADSGATDLGALDAGDIEDPWAHCPDRSEYVGDDAWGAALSAGAGAQLCAYPRQNDGLLESHPRKQRLAIVPGRYPFPLMADRAPFFLPACLGPEASPNLMQGTVSSKRMQGFDDPEERYYVQAQLPVSDGRLLSLSMRRPTDQPDLVFDGLIDQFETISARLCNDADCLDPSDLFFLPCSLPPVLCDRLSFAEGEVAIEQFHWVGPVGAGFASPISISGRFQGESFEIRDYDRMTMSYGHHAFTRSLLMFFEAPISGVCGLQFDEVSEFGQITRVKWVDCDGAMIGSSGILNSTHERAACP